MEIRKNEQVPSILAGKSAKSPAKGLCKVYEVWKRRIKARNWKICIAR